MSIVTLVLFKLHIYCYRILLVKSHVSTRHQNVKVQKNVTELLEKFFLFYSHWIVNGFVCQMFCIFDYPNRITEIILEL